MKRIFKFDNYDDFNHVSNDEIRVFDETLIEKGYNLYGCLRLDEDFEKNLKEFKSERNEAFEQFKKYNENYSLADVKEFLKDFIDDYEYDTSFSALSKRPKKWVVYEDEEAIFGESELKYFRQLDGSEIDKSVNVCEYITEWDGSNWIRTYLTADWFDTFVEEITDEYEDVEEKIDE